MKANISWLDLTATDRNTMRKILDQFSEQGTVDELGIGTLRDQFSIALFPGTSSIQTRLRYVFFISWMYKELERKKIFATEIEEKARKEEISLIKTLMTNGEIDGVIGITSQQKLKRLPSDIYWTCLQQWGLFVGSENRSSYHRNFEHYSHPHTILQTDDNGISIQKKQSWNPHIPSYHDDKSKAEVTLRLTLDEAQFILYSLQHHCSNTLLEFLASNPDVLLTEKFEDLDVSRASKKIQQEFNLACRFSLHVHGATLLYNYLLAQARLQIGSAKEQRCEEWMKKYQEAFVKWAIKEREEHPFKPEILWAFMANSDRKVPPLQKKFIEQWSLLTNSLHKDMSPYSLLENETLHNLIHQRETQLKGNRSRLNNSDTTRLLNWSGSTGSARLNFRWHKVQQLLKDLHDGFNYA